MIIASTNSKQPHTLHVMIVFHEIQVVINYRVGWTFSDFRQMYTRSVLSRIRLRIQVREWINCSTSRSIHSNCFHTEDYLHFHNLQIWNSSCHTFADQWIPENHSQSAVSFEYLFHQFQSPIVHWIDYGQGSGPWGFGMCLGLQEVAQSFDSRSESMSLKTHNVNIEIWGDRWVRTRWKKRRDWRWSRQYALTQISTFPNFIWNLSFQIHIAW